MDVASGMWQNKEEWGKAFVEKCCVQIAEQVRNLSCLDCGIAKDTQPKQHCINMSRLGRDTKL